MKQIAIVKPMSGKGSLTYWVEIKLITAAHRLFLLLWFGTKDLGDDILFFFMENVSLHVLLQQIAVLRKKQNMKKSNLISNIVKVHNQPDGLEVWIPAAAVVLSVAFFLSYFRFLFSYSFHISVSCFCIFIHTHSHTHFMIITAQHVSQKLALISFLSFLPFF